MLSSNFRDQRGLVPPPVGICVRLSADALSVIQSGPRESNLMQTCHAQTAGRCWERHSVTSNSPLLCLIATTEDHNRNTPDKADLTDVEAITL